MIIDKNALYCLLNLWASYEEIVFGVRVVQIWVVPHGPDYLLCPRGAALWVGHHQHVIGPELCGQFFY